MSQAKLEGWGVAPAGKENMAKWVVGPIELDMAPS